jgi:hypothetical protein
MTTAGAEIKHASEKFAVVRVKMQLNYYISPRLEKREPTISWYSEVYCLVKTSESENV